jgi:hypothetical protein
MRRRWWPAWLAALCLLVGPAGSQAAEGDGATHQSDHAADAPDVVLPDVHVHGLPLNKDQQLGPVPTFTPWPAIPASLDGQELDDWMKARLLVSRTAEVTVVVLEPAKHRELTQAGLTALNRWKFEPQLRGDDPVDGELTVRIHFRSR